jgi:hypothetical protein
MPGGCVVRDANGQALAYLYSRENKAEARQAKTLTADEVRRIAINIMYVRRDGSARYAPRWTRECRSVRRLATLGDEQQEPGAR